MDHDEDPNRFSRTDAGQGAGEQRTEPYKKYGEGAEKPATPSSAVSSDGVSGSAGKQAGTARKSILCVEDEHFISELYVRALEKAGYQVKVVVDGEAGLREAQTDAYDLILLDIMVPNLTGNEVLRRLRDPRETPRLHAKIVITTNLVQDDASREAVEKQADGYIIKAEITPRQLVEFVQQIHF